MVSAPTQAQRRLAAELHRYREAAGLTLEQAAGAVQLSRSTLSRIENAQVGVASRTVAALLRRYAVPDAVAAGLVDLARDARRFAWWQEYAPVVPAWLAAYVACEDAATRLRIYRSQLVPDLFQRTFRGTLAVDGREESSLLWSRPGVAHR